MSRNFFLIWSALAVCIAAPIVAGFLDHFLMFRLINSQELERMYAEDGFTLAQARESYFSAVTAGLAVILTPLILAACLAPAFLASVGRPSYRPAAVLVLLAVPIFLAIRSIFGAIAEQQVGGIAWGSAMLSGPLIYSISLVIREKRMGVSA